MFYDTLLPIFVKYCAHKLNWQFAHFLCDHFMLYDTVEWYRYEDRMKKKLWRLFLMVWVVFCGIYYCSGPRGLLEIRSLQELNKQLGLEVMALENRVESLRKQIESWSHEPFFKEKLAREQLQLAYPEDIVYYVVDEK